MDRNDVFESMPIPKAYFKMALPVVVGMVISLVYNMVDTWFIARTQDTFLVAGVSLCSPIMAMMVAFGDIFGLGGSSVISRLFGQKDYDRASGISACCFWASIVFGLIVTAVMLVFRTPILRLLGADADTMASAKAYYTWLAIGAAAIIFSLVPNNILRTEVLATEAMVGSVAGSVINIILDPIFIFTLGMGAGGAAAATILSNLLTDLWYLYIIKTKARHLSLSPVRAKKQLRSMGEVFSIGFPASITNLMQSFSMLLTNRFLLAYGAAAIASLGIALKVNMIIMLVLAGFAFGAQSLLGYCYGSGNKERLHGFIRFDLLVLISLSAIMLLIASFFAPQIIYLFMQDSEIVTTGALMLRCIVITTPCLGIIYVMITLFQAAGKALPALLLSLSRQGVMLLVTMLVLSSLFGFHGIILAQAASDVLTLLLAVILWKKSGI